MDVVTQHEDTASATTRTLIVFVHGNGLTKSCFRPTMAAVLKLNERNPQKHALHCLNIDLPGHGESSSAGELLEHLTTFSHFARVVADQVQAYLASTPHKFDEKILCAHSIGCQMMMLAQKWLKFDRAVLVEPIGVPKSDDGERMPAPENFVNGCKNRRRNFPSFQGAYDALRPKGMYAAWEEESVKEFVFHGGLRRVAAGDGQEVELCCHPYLESRIFSLDIAEVDPELPSMKFKSSVVMVGAKSMHLPLPFFEMTAEKLGAEMVTVEDSGHVIICDDHKVVAEQVYRMLVLAQQQRSAL